MITIDRTSTAGEMARWLTDATIPLAHRVLWRERRLQPQPSMPLKACPTGRGAKVLLSFVKAVKKSPSSWATCARPPPRLRRSDVYT
ncbi:hypothetical protein [Streptomyces roseoverticillatus]|uniref:hypothetical protein n=1 Tax=Streptomyces roseoverticillatus TaxID=66429 RepID=UPI001F254F34|nr:hypothetical protein [Streptomyces roseoverticillatus]